MNLTKSRRLPATSLALGVLLACSVLLTARTEAGSGKHLVPIGFFAREGVKTHADAWRVVQRTKGEVEATLTPERNQEARLPLDIMIEALSWMRRRTHWTTSDGRAQPQLKQSLSEAISAAHDLHAEVHRSLRRGWTIEKAWERYETLHRELAKIPPHFPAGQLALTRQK